MLTPTSVARTISEVKVAAAEEQARLSRPLPDPVRWYRRPSTAVVMVAFAAAVWGVQAMVWNRAPRLINDRDRDAGLRFTMALQVVKVEDFRERTGRLPKSFTELGENYQGMTYMLVDTARYRLTGTSDQLTLTYRSDSSLQSFVGGSMLSIRDRKRP